MRVVLLDQVKPGMRLGRTIIDADGKVLLTAGVILNSSYCRRLKEKGYASVYVADGIEDDLVIPEVISQETRVRAVATTKTVLTSLISGGRRDLSRLRRDVENIVDEILDSRDLMVGLIDLRSLNDYTFVHSVNVAIYSVIVGKDFDYSRGQLVDLAIGTILHDLGKCLIDQDILQKPSRLTPEEFEHVRTHTSRGFETLRSEMEVNLLSAHVAFQHHERLDGSGYPRGLKGNGIIEFARVAAVADVYDALTGDRVYKPALPPSLAMRTIQTEAGRLLDPWVVDRLIRHLVPYPVATTVGLSSGETALVIKVNVEALDRPVVKVLKDGAGLSYGSKGAVIDLSTESGLSITRSVDF